MAVGRNYRNLADRLAGLPGIRTGGGSQSALVSFLYLTVVVLVVGGLTSVTAASGDSNDGQSIVSGTATASSVVNESSKTQPSVFVTTNTTVSSAPTVVQPTSTTEQHTETSRQAPDTVTTEGSLTTTTVVTSTVTATSTARGTNVSFKKTFREELRKDNVTVNVVAMEHNRDDGTFLLVYNTSSINNNATDWLNNFYAVNRAYVETVYQVQNETGHTPWKMTTIAINNSDNYYPTQYNITTINSTAYYQGDIQYSEFLNRSWNSTKYVNKTESKKNYQ
jgi:hypothetical protein